MIFAADVLELARLADSLIGYGAADGFEAQMREAIDGDFPAGADPVEVCLTSSPQMNLGDSTRC